MPRDWAGGRCPRLGAGTWSSYTPDINRGASLLPAAWPWSPSPLWGASAGGTSQPQAEREGVRGNAQCSAHPCAALMPTVTMGMTSTRMDACWHFQVPSAHPRDTAGLGHAPRPHLAHSCQLRQTAGTQNAGKDAYHNVMCAPQRTWGGDQEKPANQTN